MRPISPDEIECHIPEFIIQAANKLISQHYDGSRSGFRLNELMHEARALAPDGFQFKSWMWNIEETYRKAGWKVEYDQPGYNESYPATFTFTRKSK